MKARLEQIVRNKLEKGWNAFTREEVEALLENLQESRRSKRRMAHRLHTSHGDAVGWHFEGDVGLHARRPAPDGAVNLFEKPRTVAFESGWRVPTGLRIHGFFVNPNGELKLRKPKAVMSPNDWMRLMHQALTDLTTAYKHYESIESNPSDIDQVCEAGADSGRSGEGVELPDVPEQPSTGREDL